MLSLQIKKVSECMLQEVVWREEGTVPSLYQHLSGTTITTFYWALACISFVGMSKDEESNKEIFQWVHGFPTIIMNACMICRLMDDIVDHEVIINIMHILRDARGKPATLIGK